jgi:hypothetical protein
MTQKPGESTEEFAARISGQIGTFFKPGNDEGTPAEPPSAEAQDETSPAPTDESAGPEAPEEE